MLTRITNLITGSGDLVRAEAEILATRLLRSLVGAICVGVCLITTTLGVVGLIVAGTALLTEELGWITALAIVSAGIALIAGIATLITIATLRAQIKRRNMPTEAKALAAQASRKLSPDEPRAADETRTQPAVEPKPAASNLKDQVAAYIADNPGVALGSALAAVSILGPGRTLKYAGRGMLIAQMAKSAIEQAGSSDSRADSAAHHNGRARPYAHAGTR